jgi:hypothetical protein
LLAAADHKVFVPCGHGGILNVAVAAGIILFEFLRAGLVTKKQGCVIILFVNSRVSNLYDEESTLQM